MKQVSPASEIVFSCPGNTSYMQEAGKIISLVVNSEEEAHMVCYNVASESITTIKNFGFYDDE